MPPRRLAVLAAMVLAGAPVLPLAAAADTGRLALFADGEDLATEGFLAPKLTRDGWELRFDSIRATLANVAAYQTEPPHDASSGASIEAAVAVTLLEGPLTVDLVRVGENGQVAVAEVEAPAGFYNALSWDLVPGEDGASLVLEGTATRDGEAVPFTITATDGVRHLCGEHVGDARKGMLAAGGSAALDATFHLDHLFGRADRAADDAMNLKSLGFDMFAEAGGGPLSLAGLHVGHVGEGHCHVEPL